MSAVSSALRMGGDEPSDAQLIDSYSRTVANVADHVGPAVCAITSGGRCVGSGVTLSPNGLIVTNHHVVASMRSPALLVYFGRYPARNRYQMSE